jgi:26S proteasome regulatory subunit N10
MPAPRDDRQDVVFLIDNSSTSINGDFYPNRLQAQQMAVERLTRYFAKLHQRSEYAIGTLGNTEFGICASLTSSTSTLFKALPKIVRGGEADLARGIRCAFLSLHVGDPEIKRKRIIVMLGSSPVPPITPEVVTQLVTSAKKENVWLDIVTFGEDVDLVPLQALISQMGDPNSHFIHCRSGGHILSDAILSSEIGPGLEEGRRIEVAIDEDPDLALTLRLSMEDQMPDELELAAALRASLEDNEGFATDDTDIMAAIEASLRESGPPGSKRRKPDEHDEEESDSPE